VKICVNGIFLETLWILNWNGMGKRNDRGLISILGLFHVAVPLVDLFVPVYDK